MARPVKETPVLRGEDAEAFARALEASQNNKVPRQEYDRAMAIFERVVQRTSPQK